MTIIYETGEGPAPKERYRVEVLRSDGTWREVNDIRSSDVAKPFADSAAREYRTRARVRDAGPASTDHGNGSRDA